ncbi:hypothetical protein EDD17DRAFT_128547 [Pisolithus thermaeus]|nr:hypothetical protein EDD17DRAFT_128547 [Pisolithus thermaeus]
MNAPASASCSSNTISPAVTHGPVVRSVYTSDTAVSTPELSPVSSQHPPAPPTQSDPSNINHSTSNSMAFLHSDNQTNSLSHNNPSEFPSKAFLEHSGASPVDSSFQEKVQGRITPSRSFPAASDTEYSRRLAGEAAENVCSEGSASPTSTDPERSMSAQRTPNIYINGLPPHFSEQDLFALTRPFGVVKSVRTFTRHVSEKPTGYGFVLFSDIESAERCIEGLRKYRNLHPSFSKQVHRIPGTIYAQQSIAQPAEQDPASFKARMERLKDETSTNLYIEGLPLTIDEKSLAALMTPHKIKSSRFFKTKLSDPPRIIAFVRLETRAAAEETIERLHGRMVRGWNDPGCRISVRFADSPEQRELRRTERVLKSGDNSPSRLTIAQAALLNLRGQELQTDSRKSPRLPQYYDPPPAGRRSPNAFLQPQPALDYIPALQPLPVSPSASSNLVYNLYNSPVLPVRDLQGNTEMDVLLQSTQGLGVGGPLFDYALGSNALGIDYQTAQSSLQSLASTRSVSSAPSARPRGQTQARNGFTPAEEVILQTHARRLRIQTNSTNETHLSKSDPTLTAPVSDARDFTSNQLFPSTNRFPAAPNQFQLGRLRATKSFQDFLSTISEDETHALVGDPWFAAQSNPMALHGQGALHTYLSANVDVADLSLAQQASHAIRITTPNQDEKDQSWTDLRQGGTGAIGGHRSQLRLSTTSICRPVTTRSSCADNDSYYHHSSNPSDSPITIGSSSEINTDHVYPQKGGRAQQVDNGNKAHAGPVPRVATSHTNAALSPSSGDSARANGSKSPTVVSPALTYSSRTPSTLSPSTPFFGSFGSIHDMFEAVTMGNGGVMEKDVEVKVRSK